LDLKHLYHRLLQSPDSSSTETLPEVRPAAGTIDSGAFRMRFWGVRGTHPAALVTGTRYGGNTTCLEIRYRNHIIIIDAGSGIVPLGDELVRELRDSPPGGEQPTFTLLFTHAHHDHLCGLPFFAPLYQSSSRLQMLGPDLSGMRFQEIIAGYMRSPYFPIDFWELPSQRILTSIGDGARLVWLPDARDPVIWSHEGPVPAGSLVVDAFHSQFHPREGTLIYRISAGGRSVAFATDVEFETGEERPDNQAKQRYLRFIQGVDVLIHDAQYSEGDYSGAEAPTRGFGHSTSLMAAHVACKAEVGKLILFHHDPGYADSDIHLLEQEARQIFPATTAAREGAEIFLDASRAGHI